jgi:uncharacterized protein
VLIVVSPAKSLDYETPLVTKTFTEPRLLDESEELIAIMRKKKTTEIAKLMSISDSLAQLNFDRYHDWHQPFTPDNARAALLAFNGDVYDGMQAPSTFKERDFAHAQKTLRILSGLYGVLRPLDLMQPYRLEMGTKLKTKRGANLYDFWGNRITEMLIEDLDASPGEKALINLASTEYFGSVKADKLGVPIIAPTFLDGKGGKDHKIVSFFAKKARGAMSGWLIRERIKTVDELATFTELGYAYDPVRSTATKPTFVRHDSVGHALPRG